MERPGKRLTLALTGASGSAFGVAVLRRLSASDAVSAIALLASPTGKRCLLDETGMTVKDLCGLPKVAFRDERDLGADISSGSHRQDGMVVVPCSAGTLGRIAAGTSEGLVSRAADVCLKERRPLVIVHRETPLSLIDIENYRTLTLAGAILCPANPGFYLLPKRVEDLVDFVAGKVLDLLKVRHTLATRWEEHSVAIRDAGR